MGKVLLGPSYILTENSLIKLDYLVLTLHWQLLLIHHLKNFLRGPRGCASMTHHCLLASSAGIKHFH
jgi:hypothetical protein